MEDNNAAYLRKKFWEEDFQKGSPVGKPYEEIKRFAKMTYDEAVQFRTNSLKSLLDHARRNTEFYSKFMTDNLADYPVMDKTKLLQNYDSLQVDYDKLPDQRGPLHIQSTSGSTGTPFRIPQDYHKRQRRIAELKYFGEIVGFNSHEMLVHLRTWNRWQSKTPEQIKKENIIPFDISDMGDEKMGELCKTINENRAICLRGYASSFDLLARYAKENSIAFPSVKIIIAGSEALPDDVRARVKASLGCEIISQYANEECGILAQERIPTNDTDNPMYMNNSGYIFECLKIGEDVPAAIGEMGRLVITDLNNYAFPVIRYDTGDAVVFGAPDEFSNGFPVIEKLYGRRLDVCYTTSNLPFSPMTIGRILKHYDKIQQWQFIQKGKTDYLLKVILAKESQEEYMDKAIRDLKETIGEDANIKLERVDGIPVLASGKRKPVMNEYKNK